jgi:hypothetical protein
LQSVEPGQIQRIPLGTAQGAKHVFEFPPLPGETLRFEVLVRNPGNEAIRVQADVLRGL